MRGAGTAALSPPVGRGSGHSLFDSGPGAISGPDGGTVGVDATAPLGTNDAAPDPGATSDAGSSGMSNPSSQPDAAPAPECDATHPCSAGFVCTNNACVSACTQTQCDPNATCSLVNNAPTCACNGDYVNTGTGNAVVCTQDPGCNCDSNATCEVVGGLHKCNCKSGYTGDGTTCAPVSCPAPTLANGTVTTSDGTNHFGVMATYKCNAGYDFPSKVASISRTCGADMSWGAAVPDCSPKDCGEPELPRFSDGVVAGSVSTPQGTTYNSTAQYRCSNGLSLSGTAVRTCGANGWSGTTPTCIGCGDRQVTPSEACDPTGSGWNAWTCSATCDKKVTIYTAPPSNTCNGGEVYSMAYGVCMSQCSRVGDCPNPPTGRRTCAASGSCFASCNSSSDCAPNLKCYVMSGSSSGVCITCSVGTAGGECR